METIVEMLKGILKSKYVAYPLAAALFIIGLLCFITMIWSIYVSYREAKRTGKPTSWLKITDDIRWTMYCWSEKDQEYVMSLPRLIYFVSALLIIYVVLAGKTDMLTPLLGFNLSSMVSYTSKRYLEGKAEKEQEDREDKTEMQELQNEFQLKLAEINNSLRGSSSFDTSEDEEKEKEECPRIEDEE